MYQEKPDRENQVQQRNKWPAFMSKATTWWDLKKLSLPPNGHFCQMRVVSSIGMVRGLANGRTEINILADTLLLSTEMYGKRSLIK